MRRALWAHQFSQMSEQTPADYAATLLPRGITGLYIKAMDEHWWMGSIYQHPLAPRSQSQFSQLVAEFADVGLELIPWVVPRRLGSEAEAHLTCAVRGKLIIDWEYQYAGFWQGSDSEAWAYHNRLRQAVAEGTWIASAPDPRQVARDFPTGMIAGLSAYQPQNYWTDFQRPWRSVMESAPQLRDLGPVEPILPYNGTTADVQGALEWCVQQGYQAVSCWRMGTANAAQLDAFAQRVEGETDPEEPPVNCEAETAPLINAISYVSDDLGDKLLAEARRTAVRKTVVRQIVAEMSRVRTESVGPRP